MPDVAGVLGVDASAAGRKAGSVGFGIRASVIRVKKSKSSCERCVLAAATDACSFRFRVACALDDEADVEVELAVHGVPCGIPTPTPDPDRSS